MVIRVLVKASMHDAASRSYIDYARWLLTIIPALERLRQEDC